MNQDERLDTLISELISEQTRYSGMAIPENITEKKQLFRALVNVRPPGPASSRFLKIQDEYLHTETDAKGITNAKDLVPINGKICLWQGDITTLKCGAIVNAANSGLTGCYYPCHGCIDNAIHTYAGIQLRLECAGIINKQGHEEPQGKAKITKAYNLPCSHIIHTVGPIVQGNVKDIDRRLLRSCYRECLTLAEENGIDSIAFCCISTGEFHFPNEEAAEIAVDTVYEYMKNSNIERVIFNVFKDKDLIIYKRLLSEDRNVKADS